MSQHTGAAAVKGQIVLSPNSGSEGAVQHHLCAAR